MAVRRSDRPLPLEGRIDSWLAQPSGLGHHIANAVVGLGDVRQFTVLVLVVVIGLVLAGDVAVALVTGAGVGLQLAVVELLLKPSFGRHLAGSRAPSYRRATRRARGHWRWACCWR